MDDTCEFTIYNLQIIFADLKKSWVIHMQYAFTIYDLQIIFADSKKNIDDT